MRIRVNVFFFLSSILFFSVNIISIQGQGIAINPTGTPPDASAILDVQSVNQGFLPPKMTTTQRNAIVAPAEGLIIWNTTTECPNYFKGGQWHEWCASRSLVAGNGITIQNDTVQLNIPQLSGSIGYSYAVLNSNTTDLYPSGMEFQADALSTYHVKVFGSSVNQFQYSNSSFALEGPSGTSVNGTIRLSNCTSCNEFVLLQISNGAFHPFPSSVSASNGAGLDLPFSGEWIVRTGPVPGLVRLMYARYISSGGGTGRLNAGTVIQWKKL
jgi:hypothetical protein